MNGDKALIVHSASISSIDFTSLYFASRYKNFSNCTLIACINENVRLSTKIRNRRFESRLSLPTSHIGKSPDGSFRQIFIPIEKYRIDNIDLALGKMIASYKAALIHSGFDELANAISERGNKLMKKIHESSLKRRWSPGLTSVAILNAVYDLLELKRFDVFLFHDYFEDNSNEIGLIESLRDYLANVGASKGKFLKGGSVDLVSSNDLSIIDRLISFELDKRTLVLKGKKHKLVYSEDKHISLKKIDDGIISIPYKLRLRGPVDLTLPLKNHKLGHIPWFCEIDDEFDSSIEFVSPLTAVSKRRSNFESKNTFKLNPSGYSLIDYGHPNIWKFLIAILNLNSRKKYCFREWQKFSFDFPATKEKGAKYQGSIASYLQFFRQKIIKKRPKSTRTLVKKWIELESAPDIPEIGFFLSCAYETVDYIGACCSPQSNIHMDAKVKSILREASILAREWINTYHIIDRVIVLAECFHNWRNDCGWGDVRFEFELDRLYSLRMSMTEDPYIALERHKEGSKTPRKVRRFHMIRSITKNLLIDYSSLVMLLLNTVLKADILKLYLLLGSAGVKESIDELLSERKRLYLTCSPMIFVMD